MSSVPLRGRLGPQVALRRAVWVLAIGLIILIAWGGISIFAWFIAPVDERWPLGETARIRAEAVALLPPPPGARFVTLIRTKGAMNESVNECLYYDSPQSRQEIFAYYRGALGRLGWRTFAYPHGDTLFTVHGSSEPSSNPGGGVRAEPDVDWEGVTVDTHGPVVATAPPATFHVCATSWDDVRRSLPIPAPQ